MRKVEMLRNVRRVKGEKDKECMEMDEWCT